MASFIIVEDDLSFRYLIKAMLEKAGHTILAAVDSTDKALDYLRLGRVPDMITLDVVLPGGRGTKLIGYLREHHKAVKIAVVTGLDESQVLHLAPPSSYDGFIQKPFVSEEFLKRISAILAGPQK